MPPNLQADGEELSSKIWNSVADFQLWSTLLIEFTLMIKSPMQESRVSADRNRPTQCASRLRRITPIMENVKTLIENKDGLKSTLEIMLDQLANPSLRSKIFAIVDALAGGTPAAISSGGGGGGNSNVDLRWDGRKPDEEEEAYRRRCLIFAIGIVTKHNRMYNKRK